MIVVAGGTGVLGARVVGDLLALGCPVRVLVRDADRARTMFGERVGIAQVDVRHSDGVLDAVAGAEGIVSAVHGLLGGRGAGPQQVDVQGNAHLAAAAREVGAKVVLVSVIGAAADSPAELLRAKHCAEQMLRSSGVPWSIVRAAPFIETWVRVLRDSARSSGRPVVMGHGTRPVPFVSVDDVSAVVVHALTDASQGSRVLEIAGEPRTMWELAVAVQDASGHPAAPRRLPRPALHLASLARPFSPAVARLARMALLMDTVDLGCGDDGLRERLGLGPTRTVHDVLH